MEKELLIVRTAIGKGVITKTTKTKNNPVEESIYADLRDERTRQRTLWGEQTETSWGWISILMEEVGEVAREVNEHDFMAGPTPNMEAELVQVAAVAIAWLTDIRNRRE